MNWDDDEQEYSWGLALKILFVFFVCLSVFALVTACSPSYHERCYEGNMACMSAEEMREALKNED